MTENSNTPDVSGSISGDPGRTIESKAYQPLVLENGPKPAIENTCQIHPLANISPMKNAASDATDNGVNLVKKAANFPGDNSPKQRCNAIAEAAAPEHIRAINMLAFALTLETSDGWAGASAVWEARLTEPERVALAFSALNSLSDDTAYLTASAALFGTLNGEAVA